MQIILTVRVDNVVSVRRVCVPFCFVTCTDILSLGMVYFPEISNVHLELVYIVYLKIGSFCNDYMYFLYSKPSPPFTIYDLLSETCVGYCCCISSFDERHNYISTQD